ncbi:hypothetical protein [Burkholderia ubonensis]|uniref:hypothetical protein n=1 Tax=Burkholderia ubonensis TaxID=101571 RepID=UPI00075333AB|nr:hypothetical protein [Burkholderia ubonensis]KVD37127.1 hypothetical protein WI83_07480 [Burkholderia ubonensis]
MASPSELATVLTFQLTSQIDTSYFMYVQKAQPGQVVAITSQNIPKTSLKTWIYDPTNSKLFLQYDFDQGNEDSSYRLVVQSTDGSARIRITPAGTDDCLTWTMVKFKSNQYRFDSIEKPGYSLGLLSGVGDGVGVVLVETDTTWQTLGQIWQASFNP